MAGGTVRGGQQGCNQACRPCDGGVLYYLRCYLDLVSLPDLIDQLLIFL